jgi:hypothetical protein
VIDEPRKPNPLTRILTAGAFFTTLTGWLCEHRRTEKAIEEPKKYQPPYVLPPDGEQKGRWRE